MFCQLCRSRHLAPALVQEKNAHCFPKHPLTAGLTQVGTFYLETFISEGWTWWSWRSFPTLIVLWPCLDKTLPIALDCAHERFAFLHFSKIWSRRSSRKVMGVITRLWTSHHLYLQALIHEAAQQCTQGSAGSEIIMTQLKSPGEWAPATTHTASSKKQQLKIINAF